MGSGQTPLVSIGLPVFNGENYLWQAMESLLGQTMADFELIVADNASTDATEHICREWASRDSRVRYFRHEANKGATPNYNFTLDQANGEYFLWAAHDDLREATFLEQAVAEMERVPGASVVFSQSVRINERGEPFRQLKRPLELTSEVAAKRFKAAITCRHPCVVAFGLMRRSLLNSTGRLGAFAGADRVLIAELALAGPFIELPGELFFSRDHPARYVNLKARGGRVAQSVWWDSQREGVIDIPALNRLKRYIWAVYRADLTLPQRGESLSSIFGALLHNRGAIAREILGDLARALTAAMVRAKDRRPTRPGVTRSRA